MVTVQRNKAADPCRPATRRVGQVNKSCERRGVSGIFSGPRLPWVSAGQLIACLLICPFFASRVR